MPSITLPRSTPRVVGAPGLPLHPLEPPRLALPARRLCHRVLKLPAAARLALGLPSQLLEPAGLAARALSARSVLPSGAVRALPVCGGAASLRKEAAEEEGC